MQVHASSRGWSHHHLIGKLQRCTEQDVQMLFGGQQQDATQARCLVAAQLMSSPWSGPHNTQHNTMSAYMQTAISLSTARIHANCNLPVNNSNTCRLTAAAAQQPLLLTSCCFRGSLRVLQGTSDDRTAGTQHQTCSADVQQHEAGNHGAKWAAATQPLAGQGQLLV